MDRIQSILITFIVLTIMINLTFEGIEFNLKGFLYTIICIVIGFLLYATLNKFDSSIEKKDENN